MTRKLAYLSVETKVREFDAKLLLAAALAERGFEVFLGHKERVVRAALEMPPGIFLEKSSAITKVDLFRSLRSMGHDIVVHDEEGLVVVSDESYIKKRISFEALSTLTRFFTWGNAQTLRIAEVYPEYGNLLIPSGHPRIDLLSPNLSRVYNRQVDAIRSRFPRYILVNTKFGTCNNAMGKEAFFNSNMEAGLFADEMEIHRWRGYFEFSELLFREFMIMLPALSSEFPDLAIVIRPHPSERIETWYEFARTYHNVHVAREGNVIPWIRGALLVLHNGCTTAIESFYLGVPAVAYRPITSDKYDIHLPNSVSHQSFNIPELFSTIRQLIEGETPGQTVAQRKIVTTHISSNDGILAADRIADEFEVIQRQLPRFDRSVFHRIKDLYIKSIRSIEPTFSPSKVGKFEPLNISEVREFIVGVSALTGRFRNLKVVGYGENCVRILQV